MLFGELTDPLIDRFIVPVDIAFPVSAGQILLCSINQAFIGIVIHAGWLQPVSGIRCRMTVVKIEVLNHARGFPVFVFHREPLQGYQEQK